MGLDGNGDDGTRELPRRELLRIAGVGGVVGIAGCAAAPNPGGDGGTDFSDRILRLPIHLGTRPRNGQFNPFGKNSLLLPGMYEKGIDYDPYDDSFVPYLLDWEVSGDTLTLTVDEDASWHNGDDVTAEDVSVSLKISKVQTPTSGLQKYYDEVNITGDKTLELPLTDDWSTGKMLFRLHGMRVTTKWSQLGDHVEAIEDATSDDEQSQALTALTEDQIEAEDAVGTGMFELDEVAAQRVILSSWPDHTDADQVNFGGLRYRFYGSSQQMWTAIKNGDLDFIFGNQVLLTEEMVNTKPDHVTEIRKKRHGGLSVVPQHEDSQLGDLALRKAMMYVIDRNEAAQNANAYTQGPSPAPTACISGEVMDDWIGDIKGDFTTYGPESKPDKATQVLNEAGYTKDGGTWMDPDGNEVSVPVHVSADRGTWVAAARTVSGQLGDFGITSELEADEPSSYWSTYLDGQFEKVVMGFWGHPAARLPYFQQWLALLRSVPGQACNWPAENAEVPMPIGDPDGDTQTMNIKQMVKDMEKTDDQEELKETVQTVGWMYNQRLPQLPLLQGFHQAAVTRDEWEMPDKEDDAMDGYLLEKVRLPNFLLRRDKLEAVEPQ